VSDVLMPPIGILLGNVDFSNLFIVLKKEDRRSLRDGRCGQGGWAVTVNYGLFVNAVVNFLIVALPSSSWSAA